MEGQEGDDEEGMRRWGAIMIINEVDDRKGRGDGSEL